MRVRFSLVLASAALFASNEADAQTLPSIDARTWAPPLDPGAGLVLEPVATPSALEPNFAAWVAYAHHPITLRKAGTDEVAFRPVEHQLTLDLTANVGLGARAAVGVDVPLVLFQDGTSNLPSTVATQEVPTTALGDVHVGGKVVVVPNETGGFGLAALGDVGLPTGARSSFAGEGSLTAGARLLAEYSLVIASVQASAGFVARTAERTWPAESAGGITFGNSIPWTFGLTLRPDILKIDRSNRQRWDVALHGSLPAGPVGPFGTGDPGSAHLSPVLLALSDRIEIGRHRDVFVLAGVDIGISDAVGVPAFRAVASLGWAPRNHDKDGDGVDDDVDQCPEIPEDRDGFEDGDGCPDVDDDDDGVLDRDDACPRVPGVPSDDPKKNGCPAGDRDGDGVTDDVDACPDAAGVKSADPKKNGCAADRDGDQVPDVADRCPDAPEDRDGYQDDDGCPDPDDDGDGVLDAEDACPRVAGERASQPDRNGCPSNDPDGDTFEGAADQCPDAAEVWNGVKDDDGCPDEGGKPLVVEATKGATVTLRLAAPVRFVGPADAPEIDAASQPTVRALAAAAHRLRDATLGIGVRPEGATDAARQVSLARAEAVARAVTAFAHRESAAEAVAWSTAQAAPGSASGVAVVILPRAAPPTTPGAPPSKGPLAPVPAR